MDELTKNELETFRHELKRFVEFEDKEWQVFTTYLKTKTLKKHDYFGKQGSVCKEIGFILNGLVRFFHVKDGSEITGYFCMENEFISAYKSFLTKEESLSNIQATEDCKLIIITQQNLQLMLEDDNISFKMERFGRKIAEYLICCYEDRVNSFVTQNPEERYLALLKNNKNMLKRIPQHYIANYLGITPVSLSRIRKRITAPAEKEIGYLKSV